MNESIPLGTALRVWITTDSFGVTMAVPPYWTQRLTLDEAIRLADALRAAAEQGAR